MAEINENLLREDIRKYLRTFAESYCRDAEREITKMAKYAIENFYSDYSPIYYDRTFDLRDNSYESYYKDNGSIVYGGVRIYSDKMRDYKSSNAFEVANLGWHGWHGDKDGYKGHFSPIYTRPPIAMVRQWMNNRNFLYTITKKAESKAKKQNYNYISF
ncbi:hypothetical protein [Clostridium sp.]|uniref:hypothetical protein n=1 Tax=Clostridium sp. TaxID=1506 RepID=UPI0032171504